MDTTSYRREKEFRLGVVARAISEEHDLFTVLADPLTFSARRLHFPSGPAIVLPEMPLLRRRFDEDEFDCERWDGLA